MRICLQRSFESLKEAFPRELNQQIVAALARSDKVDFNVEFRRDHTGDFVDVSVVVVKPMEFVTRPNETGDCVGNDIISARE